MSVNIISRIAIVAPATASLPTAARMRIRKIHAVMPTIIWPTPPSDVRTMCQSASACSPSCAAVTRIRLLPRSRIQSCIATPVERPMTVAIAAPSTPSAGIGPNPKMRIGSSTMLRPLATHSTRIAAAASPAPRKIALHTKSNMMTMLLPSIHCR